MGLQGLVPAGVVTGKDLLKLMEYCRDNVHALPAFNCTSSSTVNAVLQAARDIKSPVIIQFSNGGAAFYAGKGIKNDGQRAAILGIVVVNQLDHFSQLTKELIYFFPGAIAGAQHVRMMAKHYGVPVVLHSDHCAKKLLPWFDGMLEADEEYFKVYAYVVFFSNYDFGNHSLKDRAEAGLVSGLMLAKRKLGMGVRQKR